MENMKYCDKCRKPNVGIPYKVITDAARCGIDAARHGIVLVLCQKCEQALRDWLKD